MPKYPKGRPYDLIREIKQMQDDIRDLKLALSQAGISVGAQTISGTGAPQAVSGTSGGPVP